MKTIAESEIEKFENCKNLQLKIIDKYIEDFNEDFTTEKLATSIVKLFECALELRELKKVVNKK